MKELSIEEKAKAYDEAIEKVKEWYSDVQIGIGFKANLEKLFPVLKESEDERIKKDIISYIQLANQFIPQFQKDKWIAWLEKQGNNINCIYDKELSELLHIVICRYVNDPDISYIERENVSKKIFPYVELLEKQGEHANFLSKIQIGDKVTRNEDGVLVNLSQLKRVAKPAEKQGELIGDTDTVDSNEDGLIAETMKYKREQKSAWSEEDEKMLDTVIEDIVKLAGPYICYHTDVEWLKSLKERYTWKPSDEQILAIETAINVIGKGTLNGKQLVELQEQLKKLREK